MGRTTVHVGEYRIDGVLDGEASIPPGDILPDVPASAWERRASFLDDDGRLPIAVGGFVVRGAGRTVLVDLGYGPGALGSIPTGRFLDELRALGVAPGDVTDVVLTHLHRDHVGWASVDGEPTFPNAVVRAHAADLDRIAELARGSDDVANDGGGDAEVAALLAPCRRQLAPLSAGRDGLPEGMEVVAAPGHTPGSVLVVLASGGEEAVLLGDVAHCPVQLVEPGWTSAFDLDPAAARRTRRRVVSVLALRPAALLAGTHFPGLRLGRLDATDGEPRWLAAAASGDLAGRRAERGVR